MKSKFIYHLDIKPDNILYNNFDQIKFTDFGTAKQNNSSTTKTT